MNLRIISPETYEEFDIVWVELETPNGSTVILEGHAPMICSLESEKQINFCFKNGKQENMVCPGGVAEIKRDSVTLLLNS